MRTKRASTRVSSEPHFTTRVGAAAVAGMLVMQTAACGTAPKKSELQLACGGEAASAGNATTSGRAVFEYQRGGGQLCELAVLPGRYGVGVSVGWSNGWTEHTEITSDLAVSAGARYLVRARENEKGSAPVTDMQLHGYVSTPAKVLMMGTVAPLAVVFVGAVAILTLPFTLPIMLMNREKKGGADEKKPTARPAKDCCFLWIELGSTGEVVAGDAPAKQ